jgi:hypothetical protein
MKTTYTREELQSIAEMVRQQNLQPTEDQKTIYGLIDEVPPTVHSAAPSSRGSKSSMASRFSNDKKWDGGTAKGKDSLPRRDRGARGSGGGDKSAERSWRHGEKDRETFEEGFLYELRQSERHKQNLNSAVTDWESRKREQQQLGTAASVKPSKEYTSLEEVESTLINVGGSRVAKSGDDDVLEVLPIDTISTKKSRFFVEEAQPATPSPAVDHHNANAFANGASPAVVGIDIPAPSSKVVWNLPPKSPVSSNQAPKVQEQHPGVHVSLASVPSSVPPPLTSTKVTVGGQKKTNPNPRVWSAADLESHILAQQGGAKPPTPSSTAKPQTASSNKISGTFDAASLEQEIIAHSSKPLASALPTTQPGSVAPPVASAGAKWPSVALNVQAGAAPPPPPKANHGPTGVGYPHPIVVLPGGNAQAQQHPLFSGGSAPPIVFYQNAGAPLAGSHFPQVVGFQQPGAGQNHQLMYTNMSSQSFPRQ